MNYKDMDAIKILFDIGYVEFITYSSLSQDLGLKYISMFKRNIGIDDFDMFCSSDIRYESKSKLLSIFDIECDESVELTYLIKRYNTKKDVELWRERNIDINRDLKIKLLCQ
jgi:hypothetical protein